MSDERFWRVLPWLLGIGLVITIALFLLALS